MNYEEIFARISITTIVANKILILFSLTLLLKSTTPLLSKHTWFELPNYLVKTYPQNWLPKTDPTIIVILLINILLLVSTQRIENFWNLSTALIILIITALSLIVVFNRYKFDNFMKNHHYNLNIKSKLYKNQKLCKDVFKMLISEQYLLTTYGLFEKLQTSQSFEYKNRLQWIDSGEKNNTKGNKQSLYALLKWLFPKSSDKAIIRIMTECFVKSDNKPFLFNDNDFYRSLNRRTNTYDLIKKLDNL